MAKFPEIKPTELEDLTDEDLLDDLKELDTELDDLAEEVLIVEAVEHDVETENLITSGIVDSQQGELTRYLRDISQFPRISTEEEIELSQLVQAGIIAKAELIDEASDNFGNEALLIPIIRTGQLARDKFINANYKLVIAVAKHFFKHATASVSMLDIIQSGNLGLMKAVERFDYTKGYKFSTYATYWIRQHIRRDLINDATTIRIPVHVQEWLYKMYKYEKPNPDILNEALADMLGIRVDQVERLKHVRDSTAVIYLDRAAPMSEDPGTSFLDLVPSDNASPDALHQLSERDEYLHDLLSRKLTDREQYVISRRFGLIGHKSATLEEIAQEFDLSRERIRQIEAKALRKLRSYTVQRELRDFLDIK